MSDFPQQGFALRPVISSYSEYCLGIENALLGAIGTPGSGTWPTANTAIYVPLALPTPFQVQRFWWANGATASGNVDCGLYTVGGTKIASTGSTAQAGISVGQSAAPSIGTFLLYPGAYYLALVMDGVTGTVLRRGSVGIGESGLSSQATAFALPATLTHAGGTPPILPLFGIADRTFI